MKKLLSLIGTISIVGSGASAVVACGSNNASLTPQQKADAIKDKITQVALTVPVGTNPDTTNAATISAIKTALKSENATLTEPDLAKITFSDTTLQAGKPVEVIAIITVGTGSSTAIANKNLTVTLKQTAQQKADAIKDKITDVDLTVPWGTNPDTTNAATISAIKTALKSENPTLTDPDLKTIAFASATLSAIGAPVTVVATITVGVATATINLNVTRARTDQQYANAIKDKITNVDLIVPAGTDPDTTNAATISAIKTALKSENTTLTDPDLSKLTFASATLQAGSGVTVTATITVESATVTIDLSVTLAQTD